MTNEPQKPTVTPAPASTPATPQQNQGDTKPVEAPSVQPQQK
ncbi:MAG TPA: hypothetical protein VJL90_10765 [Pseudorhodoplanes sp.]|jgi:hypothetical protein|nr:hypothetical protein [Pseudorhodoplanes sp.]